MNKKRLIKKIEEHEELRIAQADFHFQSGSWDSRLNDAINHASDRILSNNPSIPLITATKIADIIISEKLL